MGFLSSLFGEKPDVPELEKLDLSTEQKAAIDANLTAAPKAAELGLFTKSQIDQMLASAGGGNLLQDSAAQIEKMVAGELPFSDQQSQQLRSVAKSFGGGTAGSESMGNLVARDLGLSELALVGKGLNAAESWLQTASNLYSPATASMLGMFINPMQQYSAHNEQNTQQFQRDWMKEQISAMPDPVLRGAMIDLPMNLISSVRGSAPNPAYGGNNYGGVGSPGAGGGGGGGGISWGGYEGWGDAGPSGSAMSGDIIPGVNAGY